MTPRRQTRIARSSPGRGHAAPASAGLALWRLFEAGAWDEARALLHPDFVARWPQSGECFRGPDNFVAVNRAHPAPGWTMTVGHAVDAVDSCALQLTLDHAEGVDHGACFYVVSGGWILEATEIWAERSPAPAWRAAWDESGVA